MGQNQIFIKAQYSEEGLGNRWNNSTTEIILSPNDPPVSERWNTGRGSDIDSVGGSENAVYDLNRTGNTLSLKTGKPDSKNLVETPLILKNFKDFVVGLKGTGVFNFRKKAVPITWELYKKG